MRGISDYTFNISEWKGIYVLVEIKDHEDLEPGSIEIIGRAKILSEKLKEPLIGILLAQDADKYLADLQRYGLDEILVAY